MKKKLIIPVLLSLCLLLASCSGKKGDVYLIGVSDGACKGVLGTKVDENMVARFSRESFNDDSAPASAQITAKNNQRIVKGANGLYYYSPDHYKSWYRIK